MRRQNAFTCCSLSMVSSTLLILMTTPTPPLTKTILACCFSFQVVHLKVVNSDNNNRKTTRKKKRKKEKHAENLEMSKTPTKIVQKKSHETQKYVSRKKKMFKTLSSERNTKFHETKICLAVYTKKKNRTKIWRLFHFI